MKRLPAGDADRLSMDPDSKLAALGLSQLHSPQRWTVLECVAWVGTRDRNTVAGISKRIAETKSDFRLGLPGDTLIGERGAVFSVRSDIRTYFCECGRPHADLAAARLWNSWSSRRQAVAAADLDAETDDGWTFRLQTKRHCLCFSNSTGKLFAVLESGQLASLGYHNGDRREVDRPEWLGAHYDVFGDLHLTSPGWTSITIDAKAVQQLWPAAFTINGETRTFEEWEVWARSGERGRPTIRKYMQKMFDERAASKIEATRALEAKACVDELKSRFGVRLDFPTQRSCEGHIKTQYAEAVAQRKS